MNKALELLEKSLQNLKQQKAEQTEKMNRLEKESGALYSQLQGTNFAIHDIENAILLLNSQSQPPKTAKPKKSKKDSDAS
jgi:uncharacterized protein YoxC